MSVLKGVNVFSAATFHAKTISDLWGITFRSKSTLDKGTLCSIAIEGSNFYVCAKQYFREGDEHDLILNKKRLD